MESRKRTGFLAKWILLPIASMFLYNVTLYFGLRGWLAQLASAARPSLQNPLSTAIALAIQLSMMAFLNGSSSGTDSSELITGSLSPPSASLPLGSSSPSQGWSPS